MKEPMDMNDVEARNDGRHDEGIMKKARNALRMIFESPDLMRNLIATAILLGGAAGSLAVEVPEGADSTPFKITMLLIIVFRIIQDAIRGTVEAITFVVPLGAASLALVAAALLGGPFVESLDKPDFEPFVISIISSASLVIFYMLLNVLLGTKIDEDGWVAVGERRQTKTPEGEAPFSHLDGETPGWPPELEGAQHRYWISYNFRYAYGSGSGSCALARTAPITCGYDIQSIAETIRLDFQKNQPNLGPVRVQVTAWQRFEAPEKPPGSTEDLPVEARSENVIAISRRRVA